MNCDNFSPKHRYLLAYVIVGLEPTLYFDTAFNPKWCAAIHQEITTSGKKYDLAIDRITLGKRALRSKWVYVLNKVDGTVERYKAYFVVLGNNQTVEVDFTKTFALVAMLGTGRSLLSVASTRNRDIHQMDIHNIFFHGDLIEKAYMHPPLSFHSSSPLQCHLRKSLYGL